MNAVNLTQILGQDDISASRSVINSNFTALASAVNQIGALADPSTSLAVFKGLTVSLPSVGTAVATVLSTNAGSASVTGNMAVGLTVSGTTGAFTTGGVTADGGDIEVKQAANTLRTRGDLQVYGRAQFLSSTLLDSAAFAVIPGSGYAVGAAYVVMMDCTGNLTLAVGQDGQVVSLYLVNQGPVHVQTTNFNALIAAPINITAKGQVLTLWFKSGKWNVLSQQGGITVTYAS